MDDFVKLQEEINNAESDSVAFKLILDKVMKITGSQYGYIAKITNTHLTFHAVVMDDWGDPLITHKPRRITLENMDTLFGLSVSSGKVVISNNTYTDYRRGGYSKLPKDHPPIKTFMAIPLVLDNVTHGPQGLLSGKVYGQIGLANASEYTETMPDDLMMLLNWWHNFWHEQHVQLVYYWVNI